MNPQDDRYRPQFQAGRAAGHQLFQSRIVACVIAVIAAIATSSDSSATLVTPFTPQQLAAYSGFVFAGTVVAVRPLRARGTILTTVTFMGLRFGKGSSQTDSLALTLEGGAIGNDLVVVDGQPTFAVGQRYIVFAVPDRGSPGNSFMPVVGLFQGYFRVGNSVTLGRGLVSDWRGSQVAELTPERVASVIPDSVLPARVRTELEATRRRDAARGMPPRAASPEPHAVLLEDEDPGTRVSEDEFLATVRGW